MLDSAVDPARGWRGMIQVWAEGAEPAFTRWTEGTAARHATYKLGRTPEAVRMNCKAAPAADERNAPNRLPLPTPPGIPGMVSRF